VHALSRHGLGEGSGRTSYFAVDDVIFEALTRGDGAADEVFAEVVNDAEDFADLT
jgi:hypothetical protein